MSTITARISRFIIATVITGTFLGAVATPCFAATAASGITLAASHHGSSPDNSPWP